MKEIKSKTLAKLEDEVLKGLYDDRILYLREEVELSLSRIADMFGTTEYYILKRLEYVGYNREVHIKTKKKRRRSVIESEGYKILSNDPSFMYGHYIKLECPQGHIYTTRVDNFVQQGKRCPECNKSYWGYDTRYAEEFKAEWKDKTITFYLVELTKGSESFFKVGLTTNLERRLQNIPYHAIIRDKFEIDLYTGAYLEEYLLNYHKDYKYTPKIKFDGRTECLTQICLNDFIYKPRGVKEVWGLTNIK